MRVAALGQAGQLNSTRLYLVRHGQVADGHTHRYHGHNDIGLSPQGVQQLERLAEQLRPVSLAAVYASDLARSREGAAILCRGRGLSFEAVPEFREINFGLWEGLTLEEIAQRYPEQLEARLRDLARYRIPEGESLGLPLTHLFRLHQNYGCLNIIDYLPDFTVVRLLNGGVNGEAVD